MVGRYGHSDFFGSSIGGTMTALMGGTLPVKIDKPGDWLIMCSVSGKGVASAMDAQSGAGSIDAQVWDETNMVDAGGSPFNVLSVGFSGYTTSTGAPSVATNDTTWGSTGSTFFIYTKDPTEPTVNLTIRAMATGFNGGFNSASGNLVAVLLQPL